jgi:hypothetical protein
MANDITPNTIEQAFDGVNTRMSSLNWAVHIKDHDLIKDAIDNLICALTIMAEKNDRIVNCAVIE